MLEDIINERPKQRKLLKTFFTMDKTKINKEQYVAEIDCLKSTSPFAILPSLLTDEDYSHLKPHIFRNIYRLHLEKLIELPEFSDDFDRTEAYQNFLFLQIEFEDDKTLDDIKDCYLVKNSKLIHNSDPFEVIKSVLRRCEIPYLDLDTGEEYREYMWINRPEPIKDSEKFNKKWTK